MNRRWCAMLIVVLHASVAFVHADDYGWPVMRIIDGDTVVVDSSADLPSELSPLSVRLRGVDTPEKGGRAQCPSERMAGEMATAYTTDRLNAANTIIVRNPEWGKWGGRVIADMIIDGESLSAALIATGHGRLYDGGRRDSWCDE